MKVSREQSKKVKGSLEQTRAVKDSHEQSRTVEGRKEGKPRQMVDTKSRRPFGYRDLQVWKKGILLAKCVYELTAPFPAAEKFGLVSQMRRAAVSIPSNIAEGHARRTAREFIQFLSHAEGSLAELDTQLQLSVELGHCTKQSASPAWALLLELEKMLVSLRHQAESQEQVRAA